MKAALNTSRITCRPRHYRLRGRGASTFCVYDKLGVSNGECVLFAQEYQRLLASQPTRRLNTSKLAESAALKTKLVDTISFMESLAVKDSNEKDMFFKRLPSLLPSLPLPVVQRKVGKLSFVTEGNFIMMLQDLNHQASP